MKTTRETLSGSTFNSAPVIVLCVACGFGDDTCVHCQGTQIQALPLSELLPDTDQDWWEKIALDWNKA
jgi:hypothetical protein